VKYPPKHMPLNPDVPKFLLTLPCVRCRCKSETLLRMKNGHDVPMCNACQLQPMPENKTKLERLAYQLQLLTGDRMTCTDVIITLSRELFAENT